MAQRLTIQIGELSRRTGCNIETIRYYERIGLLPAPARSAGRYRVYQTKDVRRLAFIRRTRELGFTLDVSGRHRGDPAHGSIYADARLPFFSRRSAIRRKSPRSASLHGSKPFIRSFSARRGMMLANIPAVLIGGRIANKLPITAIRFTAAIVFAALDALTLAGVGR